MTKAEVRAVQRAMNQFADGNNLEISPLIIDGNIGPGTRKRIRLVSYLLGFAQNKLHSRPTDEFLHRLKHPHEIRDGSREQDRKLVRRGRDRRRAHREETKRLRELAKTRGVGEYDGKPVANWMRRYLDWARKNGWDGTLISGWRDPVHSEQICRRMCGAPSCPGKCAGRASNHVGDEKPAGALDVSDYITFARLMPNAPFSPRLFNALGSRDPNHFSSTGR